jgi:Mrp family chromosome partitioning ATPase/capsular polysaccharide biosynthesis protein
LWAPVAGATGYRVEFFRGTTLAFASDTKRPDLSFPKTWIFAGRRQALKPCDYHWYVWPLHAGRRSTVAVVRVDPASEGALLTHTVLSPRIRRGQGAEMQVPRDDYQSEVRPDGVSTLRHYLQALWRRKWVGLAPLVAIPLVTLVATLRQPALYEASADVLVNRQEVATTSLIGQTPALDDAERTMATQVRLARVPLVIQRTLAAAGVTRTSTGTLLAHSSVFSLADIMSFKVSDHDPALAARLASAYARQFVGYRRELDTAGLARTLTELKGRIGQLERAGKTNSPLYVQFADREQQLESLKALRASNVTVVQTDSADDAEQVAPRPRRNTAFALATGIVVGLILVFLWESLSTRPRSEEEFEALLGMPLLARLNLGPRSHETRLFGGSTGPEADAVHALRANLELATIAVGARTVMITSPRAGEGKSATAVDLAVALARTGRHVALVDLDLRSSSITRLVGLDDRLGMTTLVRRECELADALVSIPLDDGTERGASHRLNDRWDSGPLLEVVGSGPVTGHPAELLNSTALAAVLDELRGRADIVLVDVPPVLEAPDAAAVAAALDGVLLVVSARHSRGPTLSEARGAVDTWPLARLGFALTEGGEERSYERRRRDGEHSVPTRVAEPEQVA